MSARRARLASDHANCRCWVLDQLGGWANRPPDEFATAVGADKAKFVRGTLEAERALEGADIRLFRVGRNVPIAALAVRSEFEGHREQ